MNEIRSVPSRARILAMAVLAVSIAACGGEEEGAEVAPEATLPSAVSVTVDGFSTPESALHDEESGVYLVSNISGGPMEEDNDGFISRVSPEGAIVEERWIAGGTGGVTLNAPKGMGILGDTLIVSDIDRIRLFDRNSGQPLGEWPISGVTFLNDVAVGPDGAVYVSDTGMRIGPAGMEHAGTDAVYRLSAAGDATPVVSGDSLQRPNGLAVSPAGLVVVPFGSNEVMRVDPQGNLSTVATLPGGQLDGVVRLADGFLLVSSWETSAVYRLNPDGTSTVALEGVESPADIGYDAVNNRLLVPLFQANQLRIETVRP